MISRIRGTDIGRAICAAPGPVHGLEKVMSDGRRDFARMRSILEVPILNDRFWVKVPEVASDAIMIDLEDSAAPNTKVAAREKTVEWLGRPEYFGGRPVIVRVNNLHTPWARDDLAALAKIDSEFVICYPKAQTAEELAEVRRLIETDGPARGLHVMIETARAVMELESIARADGVVGLHYGYVDLAADIGSRPFDDDGLHEIAHHYPRAKIAMAAAAYGLFATGGSLIPDYKDMEKVRKHVKMWADMGYTACIAVSPAHLDLINELMSPSEREVEIATEVCLAYQDCMDRGEPAAMVNGKVVTMPDYRVAALTLARAGVDGVVDPAFA
jgi:citrate lyase beta subunit